MTEHAVVIAGGGPTGLMLAGELALAGVDVVIVERRAHPGRRRLASRRAALAHHRGARPARHRRAVPRRRDRRIRRPRLRRDPAGHQRLPDPPQLRARRCGRATSSASWPTGSPSSACRSSAAARWSASRRTTTGVDVELSDGTLAAGGLPRRLRRRPQRGPQGGRHRLPRLGPLDQLDDRRGRDGRGARVRPAPRGRRHRPGNRTEGRPYRGRAAPSPSSNTPANPPCRTSATRSSPSYGTDFGRAQPDAGSPASPT